MYSEAHPGHLRQGAIGRTFGFALGPWLPVAAQDARGLPGRATRARPAGGLLRRLRARQQPRQPGTDRRPRRGAGRHPQARPYRNAAPGQGHLLCQPTAPVPGQQLLAEYPARGARRLLVRPRSG